MTFAEPANKRATVFIDGQNLFHQVKSSFGYPFPNYEPRALAEAICKSQGWTLTEIRFYTGVPHITNSAEWNHFWNAKLAAMGTRGIVTYQRELKYRPKTVVVPGCTCGASTIINAAQEKGVDIRIALDIVKGAHAKSYDVALIFSQDQDLTEVADEIRVIAGEQKRWIKIASAFPDNGTAKCRGINKTDWVKFDKTTYDLAIDPVDYRKKKASAAVPPATP